MSSQPVLAQAQQHSKAPAFEVRAYREGDELAWLSLFKEAFPSEHMSVEAWRWKHQRNPLGRSHMVLAFSPDGSAVAHTAVIPLAGRVLGKDCVVGQMVDAMSHPRYRGVLGTGGAFIRTVRALRGPVAEAGVSFVFGFPSGRHLRLGKRVLGYHPLSPAAPYGRLLGPGLRRRFRSDTHRIRPISRFGDQADALWHACRNDYPSAVSRDSVYLNWRYFDCPFRKYHAFAIEENGRWQGWAVVSVQGRIARLVDMLVLGTTPMEATEALIRFSLRWASSKRARYCETWLSPRSTTGQALLRAGFQRLRKPLDDLAGTILRPELELKDISDSFYFQMGDADIY